MTQQGTTKKLPLGLKAAVLIVAAAFLSYCIYWLVQGFIWGYTVTYILTHISQIGPLHSAGIGELAALFVQEYCSVVNSFVLMVCGAFAFQSAIYYIKGNPKYFKAIRRSLVLLAVFSLLLIPASVHHLLGVALGWFMVDVGVGLSYLIQALLIVPSLLILSQKMLTPQNPEPIKRWAFIAAPAYVFALYFKYLLLWWDTLVPLGPKGATLATTVGAVNSMFTLLAAGVVVAIACYGLSRGKRYSMRLAGVGLTIVGCFFVIDSLVAIFVPVYAAFWYLTDFWMMTLALVGVAVAVWQRRIIRSGPTTIPTMESV